MWHVLPHAPQLSGWEVMSTSPGLQSVSPYLRSSGLATILVVLPSSPQAKSGSSIIRGTIDVMAIRSVGLGFSMSWFLGSDSSFETCLVVWRFCCDLRAFVSGFPGVGLDSDTTQSAALPVGSMQGTCSDWKPIKGDTGKDKRKDGSKHRARLPKSAVPAGAIFEIFPYSCLLAG